jgi:integrase
MRRRRFQNPEPKRRKHGRVSVWIGQYRDLERVPRTKVLGKCSEMSKGEAEAVLAAILAPINAGVPRKQTAVFTFRQFLSSVYLPLSRRKWKASTAMTTEPTINFHLVEPLGPKLLTEILREDLQDLLDQKAPVLSFSVVDHLRWHLRAIFELAISEGAVDRNPAVSLFTPKCKAGRKRRDLSPGDINLMFKVLDLRERLAVRFALFEGMRPGEILALRWRNLGEESFTVESRVYYIRAT